MTATVYYLPTARPPGCPTAEPGDRWGVEADRVLDVVEELLATGRTSDVIVFCELAVAFLEANAGDIEDPTPLVRLAHRLGDLQRRATHPTTRRAPGSTRPHRRRPT